MTERGGQAGRIHQVVRDLAGPAALWDMDNNVDHPLTLTVEQTAKLLDIGRSTAYELVHTGDIPSLRLGRRIVVPVARLVELLDAAPCDPAGVEVAASADDRISALARRGAAGETLKLS